MIPLTAVADAASPFGQAVPLECMLWYYAKGEPRDVVQANETRTIFVKWQDSVGGKGDEADGG